MSPLKDYIPECGKGVIVTADHHSGESTVLPNDRE